jgi:hypothetical protein
MHNGARILLRTAPEANLVEIQIEKLSKAAPFVVDGIALREIRVVARKPALASPTAAHHAVYLGPMAQVIDDFGNVFRRGAVTPIDARDWELLSTGPARHAFLFLGPEAAAATAAPCCGAPPPTASDVTSGV